MHNGRLLQPIDQAALRELVATVVAEVLAQQEPPVAQPLDKLAYSESEGARLLSLTEAQLRGERKRGRIVASCGPGGKILYSRSALEAYLAGRRWTEESTAGKSRC